MKKMIFKILTILIIGLVAYFTKYEGFESTQTPVMRIVGGIMIVISLFYIFYETKHNFKFFYGLSQSAGSNANGSVVAGIGIGIFAAKPVELAILMVVMIIYVFVLSKRYELK